MTASGMLVLVEAAKSVNVKQAELASDSNGRKVETVFLAFTYIIIVIESIYITAKCWSAGCRPSPASVHFLDTFKANDKLLKTFQFLKMLAVIGCGVAGMYIIFSNAGNGKQNYR